MILLKISEATKQRVQDNKKFCSLEELKKQALSMQKGTFAFEHAIKNTKNAVIAEVKKASPSKGIICDHFPYMDIAKEYERGGATCMSVLTEPRWFMGSDEIFAEIRKSVKIPMIRKDFTIDEYQIYQAKVMGADCVLLICALLEENQLCDYLAICDELGLSALVETHNEHEIAMAVNSGAKMIGVNNRNLHDFTVDLNNSSNLKKSIPDDVIFVAESGIACIENAYELLDNGADALLIGEALMKSTDKQAFLSAIKEYKNGEN